MNSALSAASVSPSRPLRSPDEVAYRTLDARCGPRFARGFLLYEVYIRAAGFRSLAEREQAN